MSFRIAARFGACFLAFVVLGGCVSADRLVRRTNEKLSPCLRVGMTLEAAEKCMQKADLSFMDIKTDPRVRLYTNSAPAAWPVTYSVVRVKLHFGQSGELVSWSSEGAYDGI